MLNFNATTKGAKGFIDCPAQKVEAPQTAFERAFYPKNSASHDSLKWLEKQAKLHKIHIHHAMCGHGGERWINGATVDGYHPGTKPVYQYHGFLLHGCPRCYPHDRNSVVFRKGRTLEDVCKMTLCGKKDLRNASYRVNEVWSCTKEVKRDRKPLETLTRTYPHAILYDFESYGDKNQRKN